MSDYEPCEICDEFTVGVVCDFVNKCPVAKLKSENKGLKAEIERLKYKLHFVTVKFDKEELEEIVAKRFDDIEIDVETVKSEAIREFAEKLKKFAVTERVCINQRRHVDVSYVRVYDIDRLVEEMGCNDG